MNVTMKLLSSLEKVFLDTEPVERPEDGKISGFRNEVMSFQIAYTLSEGWVRDYVDVDVVSPIRDYVRVRRVRHMPVRFAAFPDSDANYLRTTPGLYPDLLSDIRPHELRVYQNQWDTLWIDVEPDENAPAGVFPVEIRLLTENGEVAGSRTARVEILDACLPEQKLIHTKWFHSDCLMNYYHVEAFSEEYWRITENFIRCAVRGGINMILMPTHTPPLDTRVGTERPTVQLVEVTRTNGEYSFGFDNLRRWVDMCKRCGVEYYEIAHLYTQWGANFTPKIVANVDGEVKRIFGWDVSATSDEYRAFLNAYIPALVGELRALGIDKKCYFHISDEPSADHLEHYLTVKNQVAPMIEGFPIMDALSNYSFYQSGAVEKPIPASNHIEPFLEGKVPGLWTYYCISQYKDVSNMFFSMPSARNRILGVQLYKFNIEGFLQWGFNFYNAQYSDYPIDPYAITDGDGFSPSGDCFQVYPGPDGMPEESIRMMVTSQAMYDLRAFQMMEALCGREAVMALIEDDLTEELTFSRYPTGDAYLLTLRKKVNQAIMTALSPAN